VLLNRILNDQAREQYAPAIQKLWDSVPDMMNRKIERANVQQAFALDTIEALYKEGNLIAAGSFEDTTHAALEKLGYPTLGVDPCINTTLEDFARENPDQRFSIGYSVSVLEHVMDDERFLRTLCRMTDNYIVLTFDYNPTYEQGMPLPTTCLRQYNEQDIIRLTDILESEGFEIFGEVDYSGDLDFQWEGCTYTFATMVARRKDGIV